MMKKGYIVIFALVALAFAAAAVLIPMMPGTVPTHYNAVGEMDGMGSRYVYLIFPAFALFMGVFMTLMARRRKDASEEKALLIVGALVTALFGILGICFGIMALKYDPANIKPVDVSRISAVILGVMMVLLGNYMPKVRRNSAVGLRTPWSMKNDAVWQRSQRFGGISGVICGFVMLICATFLAGTTVMIAVLALLIVWTVICTYMSYRYAQTA